MSDDREFREAIQAGLEEHRRLGMVTLGEGRFQFTIPSGYARTVGGARLDVLADGRWQATLLNSDVWTSNDRGVTWNKGAAV